jgi:hypothetical protein
MNCKAPFSYQKTVRLLLMVGGDAIIQSILLYLQTEITTLICQTTCSKAATCIEPTEVRLENTPAKN